MAKYQRMLYDYARPTWRWDGKDRKNEEKRLRRLKDEALANSKNKQTLFNTRRAYAKNRNLDLSLESNVLFLSKYYGERCNDIEINQHTIGKNQRKKDLRKNAPGEGDGEKGEKKSDGEERIDGKSRVEGKHGNKEDLNKIEGVRTLGINKGKKGLRKGKIGYVEAEKTKNGHDLTSPSCSLPDIRLAPSELPQPSSSAVESSYRKFDTFTDHLPPLLPSLQQQQQQGQSLKNSTKIEALPEITSPENKCKHNADHHSKIHQSLHSKPNNLGKPGKPEIDRSMAKSLKKLDEDKVEERASKLGGWKPRTPSSTKYFIYRHYYEPGSVFNHNTTQSTNIFRTVGKVDLLQAKRKPNNTLSTPNVVMTTKYV